MTVSVESSRSESLNTSTKMKLDTLTQCVVEQNNLRKEMNDLNNDNNYIFR